METATPAPAAAAPAPSATPSPTPSAPAPRAAPAGNPTKDVVAAVTGAPETPAPEAPKPPERYKFKTKVDGQEEEREYTPEEIQVLLQKGSAADKRFAETAAERKKLRQVIDYFKQDPFEAARELGLDLEAVSKKRLAEHYKMELLKQQNPGEFEKLRYQKQLEAVKREAESHKAEVERIRQEQLDQRVFKETETNFLQALEVEGLEKSPEYLREMAAVARMAHQAKIQLTPQQLALEVKAKVEKGREILAKRHLARLKGPDLAKFLGDDVVREVGQYLVAKARGGQPPQPPPAPAKVAEPEKPRQPKYTSSSAFLKEALYGK